MQDGRDGTSVTYSFSLTIPDMPGQTPRQLYDQIKAEQWRVNGRKLTCYLAVFKEGEALRPTTPIAHFKELTMQSPKFSEMMESNEGGTLVQKYKTTIIAKDANSGRSSTPNGTYADTIQRQRALELGVAVDNGAEYLALLANRTYQIP
jgi:hypothetical protein